MSSRKRYDCGEVKVPGLGLTAVFVIDWPTGDPVSEMRAFVIDTMLCCLPEKPWEEARIFVIDGTSSC